MTEKKHIPKHVVIIPDGNRRWAKNKSEKPWVGHEKASQNLEKIISTAGDLGIEYLTLWGSSLENLTKRPLLEKKALLDIYFRYFDRLINDPDLKKNKIRIRVIGRWAETFPGPLVALLKKGIEETKDHDQFHLTLCLAYSGDDEMIGAVQHIVSSGVTADQVTPDLIKSHLMTRELPSVDYLIRTGGEPHLSVGFMMWEIANAQLFFTDTLCPDFDSAAFTEAIEEFAARARRHGA